jgi:hypothetical protein
MVIVLVGETLSSPDMFEPKIPGLGGVPAHPIPELLLRGSVQVEPRLHRRSYARCNLSRSFGSLRIRLLRL